MKVYITYEKDGYEGEQVELVFANEADAQNHVIETKFKGNLYYAKKEKHELQELALEYIEAHDVKGV